jgi:NhaC family Na+:H+ antiporter
MTRTCLVPLALSCGIYAALGASVSATAEVPDLAALFSREFVLHPVCLLPAAVIFGLSLCKVNVRIAMSASILTSIPICLLLQDMTVGQAVQVALTGFAPLDPEVAAMVSGGGMTTMINTSLIVMISASYSGIFKRTGLLDKFKSAIAALAHKTTPFAAMFLTSIPASCVACNQTLAIMLTHQLCKEIEPDEGSLAIDLSDSAVVIPPLVPWSIAGAVPLAGAGAPTISILASFYLYLLPLTRLAGSFLAKKRKKV